MMSLHYTGAFKIPSLHQLLQSLVTGDFYAAETQGGFGKPRLRPLLPSALGGQRGSGPALHTPLLYPVTEASIKVSKCRRTRVSSVFPDNPGGSEGSIGPGPEAGMQRQVVLTALKRGAHGSAVDTA